MYLQVLVMWGTIASAAAACVVIHCQQRHQQQHHLLFVSLPRRRRRCLPVPAVRHSNNDRNIHLGHVILSSTSQTTTSTQPPIYNGPIYTRSDNDNGEEEFDGMISIVELTELGIDIAIGPSMIVPGQYGLYGRCCQHIESVTLPECTLLCGYGKPGTFLPKDVGDKTVGFSISSSTTTATTASSSSTTTAIFYERQLMSIQDAITKAATEYGSCGLAGHTISMSTTVVGADDVVGDDDNTKTEIVIQPIADESFNRFYCPNEIPPIGDDDKSAATTITIQNFGQYCNDLAWDQLRPPLTNEEYLERSKQRNCVQLVWRLEYDSNQQCLIPTWPVSVVSHDIMFTNHQFMEFGTKYGWNYWQAVVQLDELS